MYKKVVFIESSEKKTSIYGVSEWLIKSGNNFFCYSRQLLELNKWYEIIYRQGKNGVFRVNEARLIDCQSEQNINYHYSNNIIINQQNIFVMNNKVIEIINQEYKTRFFLPAFSKYVLYSCADTCWQGRFCNNCIELGSDIKELAELTGNDYLWENKVKNSKLIHKRTWMANNLLLK